jgi:hypothetical protein
LADKEEVLAFDCTWSGFSISNTALINYLKDGITMSGKSLRNSEQLHKLYNYMILLNQ